MHAPRITVVGSYATGLTMKVDRLPRTGETLLARGYRVDFGGKGSNQAVGCARLGASVSFIAKVGKDAFGEMALGLYREEGIDTTFVHQTEDAPTGVGFIIVEEGSGHNCITIDPGANESLATAEVEAGVASAESPAVVMTQLETPVVVAQAAMSAGGQRNAITILNPAPVRKLPGSVLALVDVLTPNETEAKVLAGMKPDAATKPEDVAHALLEKGVKQVVMTLGEKGALMVCASSFTVVPGIQSTAVDTTGAGDAFSAGLAVALAWGAALEDAVRFAVVTGGLAVRKEGVIPSLPRVDEVLDFYREASVAPPDWLVKQHAAKIES